MALADGLALGAAQAAAGDEFQVSMGSQQDAQAAIQQAVAQLKGAIAPIVDSVNQALSSASTSQQTAWADLTAGITASNTAFKADLGRAAAQADTIEIALDDGAIDIVTAETDAYWAEAGLRQKTLASRDNYLANGRNVDFDNIVAILNSSWRNGTFFVAGGDDTPSARPWYNDSWWDWANPFAYIASAYHGIKDGLVGGYEFLTKDHAAEWASYRDGKAARLTQLSMTGDVAAYQQAERQAVGQQARNVIDDAGKWANGYLTGLQLIASAPGVMRAAQGFIEGEFLNCTLLKTACFAAGTPILTPTGSRLIESLREGDEVFSRPEDDPNAPLTTGVVARVFVLTAQIWELHVAGQCIETTAEHPFYVVGEGWTPTNRLKLGDVLKGPNGHVTALDGVAQTNRTATVYNVTIEADHTFFVGDVVEWGFAVWAHNACELHHPILKVIGGNQQQIKYAVDRTLQHVPFHNAFAAALKAAGFPLSPLGGPGNSADAFKLLFKSNANLQRQVFNILLRTARNFDAANGTQFFEFAKRNITRFNYDPINWVSL